MKTNAKGLGWHLVQVVSQPFSSLSDTQLVNVTTAWHAACYSIIAKRDIEIMSTCSASWFIRISVALGSDNQMSSMLSAFGWNTGAFSSLYVLPGVSLRIFELRERCEPASVSSF